MINVKKRKNNLICSDLVAAVFFIMMGKGNIPLWKMFLRIVYLFQSISSEITCIIFLKEFISLTIVAMEIEKMQFLGYHSHGCYEEKNFCKNLNFIDSNHRCKDWIDWITVGWDKISQPQKCKFLEKGNKS